MMMFAIIIELSLGAFLYRKNVRLEAAHGSDTSTVRAYVDGKPVDSYVKE